MVRAEKYIRFSQVTEGFWGHLSSLRRGFIVNSDVVSLFENHPVPLQWSLHPLRFPRFRGTETSGAREETALLGAQNRYALRMADQSGLRQIVRDGTAGE